MTGNPPQMTLGDIENRAKNYRSARDLLGDRVRKLEDDMEQLRRQAEPMIRSALQAAKAAESELVSGIECAPGLFKKPRTHVFHGVRVGIEKGKGKLEIADEEKTIRLIRKLLPEEQAELLIKVTERVVKKSAQSLTSAELKKLGMEISAASDAVVVRPVDSELDKMLDALLKAESKEVSDSEAE